jgi:hypothetical protein
VNIGAGRNARRVAEVLSRAAEMLAGMNDETPFDPPTPEPVDVPDDEPTPAQRLRALELSGDPDAREIAQQYKSSPFAPADAAVRGMVREVGRSTRGLVKKTYAHVTSGDAAEAEEKVAAIRARRARETQEREAQLFAFAHAANRREVWMLRLTIGGGVVALVSLGTSVAALIVAISNNC